MLEEKIMIEARVNELLGKMSSAEKYAQMAQVEEEQHYARCGA